MEGLEEHCASKEKDEMQFYTFEVAVCLTRFFFHGSCEFLYASVPFVFALACTRFLVQ
jgi:hypothetical protein